MWYTQIMAPKAEQLHIRATEFQKLRLSEAARAKSMNVSQFVLQVSLEAAEEVISTQSEIVLDAVSFAEFWCLLDEPPMVIQCLRAQIEKGSVFK